MIVISCSPFPKLMICFCHTTFLAFQIPWHDGINSIPLRSPHKALTHVLQNVGILVIRQNTQDLEKQLFGTPKGKETWQTFKLLCPVEIESLEFKLKFRKTASF